MQFAAHETFHIRDGWLHKGLSVISKKPDIFSDPHATDTFGVGRNMVDALRYWLIAADLAKEEKLKAGDSKTGNRFGFTPLGKLLFKKDRFIEEDLSLWALHYHIATNKERATSWYWFFNKMPVTRFDTQTCLNYLLRWVEQLEGKRKPNITSLQKDISCLLRTYTKAHGKRKSDYSPEDSFECPFASLNLVDYLENSDSYKVNYGKRLIPVNAFAYAVLSFMKNSEHPRTEVGFQDLLSSEGSPGRAFLLSAEGLLTNIDLMVESFSKEFSFSKTAGLNTLRLRKGDIRAIEILERGYIGMDT